MRLNGERPIEKPGPYRLSTSFENTIRRNAAPRESTRFTLIRSPRSCRERPSSPAEISRLNAGIATLPREAATRSTGPHHCRPVLTIATPSNLVACLERRNMPHQPAKPVRMLTATDGKAMLLTRERNRMPVQRRVIDNLHRLLRTVRLQKLYLAKSPQT